MDQVVGPLAVVPRPQSRGRQRPGCSRGPRTSAWVPVARVQLGARGRLLAACWPSWVSAGESRGRRQPASRRNRVLGNPSAIKAAAGQLKPFAGLGMPLIVVLANPPQPHGSRVMVTLDWTHILSAMYGDFDPLAPVRDLRHGDGQLRRQVRGAGVHARQRLLGQAAGHSGPQALLACARRRRRR